MKKYLKFICVFTILLGIFIYNNTQIKYKKYENSVNVIKFASYVDGESSDNIPEKDSNYIFSKYECNNNTIISWDNVRWEAVISDLTVKDTQCTLYFEKTNSIVNDINTITLDNQGATAAGTTTVYENKTAWYSDSKGTTELTKINVPSKTNFAFSGYYTQINGGGTQVIDASGNIIGNKNLFTSNSTLYAYWGPYVYNVGLISGYTPRVYAYDETRAQFKINSKNISYSIIPDVFTNPDGSENDDGANSALYFENQFTGKYKYLKVKLLYNDRCSDSWCNIKVGLRPSFTQDNVDEYFIPNDWLKVVMPSISDNWQIVSLDISNVNVPYYIYFHTAGTKVIIDQIWFSN